MFNSHLSYAQENVLKERIASVLITPLSRDKVSWFNSICHG